MNILQILPAMNTGGVETGVVDLSLRLVKAGHKVIVVSSGGVLVGQLITAGVKHYKLPVGRKDPLTVWRMAHKLTGILKSEQVDIVHVRSRVPGWIAWLACRRARVKFVTTCHGYYNQYFTSRVMGWGCRVIVASQAIGRHMIEDFGVSYDRICFIPRGVDLEKFKFCPKQAGEPAHQKTYRVGIIGRITPLKGHPVFIRAVSNIIKTEPGLKIKAVIVGEVSKGRQDYLDSLKQLVKKLQLSEHVDFLGRRDDIPAILSELDVLAVTTTVPEAFGRVIIEAQAAGVPVVAASVGGIVDIIEDGRNGLLVPPGDDQSLARAISGLLKDNSLAQRLVETAHQDVEEKYSLDKMVERTLQVYEDVKTSLNILVIKLGALGDVILSIPSIRALRKHFPRAHISLLTDENCSQVVRGCPYLNEVIIYHRFSGWSRCREVRRVARILAGGCFDISVDLQNNKVSHLTAYLSGIPRRYGYRKGFFSRLLTQQLDGARMKISPIEHQFRLLSLLGLKLEGEDTGLELWPSEDDEKHIDVLLKDQWVDSSQLLVGINPGSSPRWPSKRWPAENYAQLCRELVARNIRTVITGTNQEQGLAGDIAQLSRAKPIIVTGKTSLLQMAALVKRCKVFVCSDTAALHVATSAGTRCVVFFGPTDPARHVSSLNSGKGSHLIMCRNLKCSPCYKGRCSSRKCLKDISVKEVLSKVMDLLDQKDLKATIGKGEGNETV